MNENHPVTTLCNSVEHFKLNSALFSFAANKPDLQQNLSQFGKNHLCPLIKGCKVCSNSLWRQVYHKNCYSVTKEKHLVLFFPHPKLGCSTYLQ